MNVELDKVTPERGKDIHCTWIQSRIKSEATRLLRLCVQFCEFMIQALTLRTSRKLKYFLLYPINFLISNLLAVFPVKTKMEILFQKRAHDNFKHLTFCSEAFGTKKNSRLRYAVHACYDYL